MINFSATLTGLAVGDALGAPFEFMSHENIQKVIKDNDWTGEFLETNIWDKRLGPGQWTDDTKMALCITRSIADTGNYNREEVALNYQKWLNSGDLRGIGSQTSRALSRMIQGESLNECGQILKKGFANNPEWRDDLCGNGTVMRIAPVGLFYKDDPVLAIKYAKEDAKLTHDHKDAIDASSAMVYLVGLLANECEPVKAVEQTIAFMWDGNVKDKIVEAHSLALGSKKYDQVLHMGVNGAAHETIGTAVFCFLRYCGDGFKSIVLNSILMGGDTDTRGAVAGALAGTHFGSQKIPKEYIEKVEHAQVLSSLDILLNQGHKKLPEILERNVN